MEKIEEGKDVTTITTFPRGLTENCILLDDYAYHEESVEGKENSGITITNGVNTFNIVGAFNVDHARAELTDMNYSIKSLQEKVNEAKSEIRKEETMIGSSKYKTLTMASMASMIGVDNMFTSSGSKGKRSPSSSNAGKKKKRKIANKSKKQNRK
jgi:hypothetical protein